MKEQIHVWVGHFRNCHNAAKESGFQKRPLKIVRTAVDSAALRGYHGNLVIHFVSGWYNLPELDAIIGNLRAINIVSPYERVFHLRDGITVVRKPISSHFEV